MLVDAKKLRSALGKARYFIARYKTGLPILKAVLMKAQDNVLTLTATDLTRGIEIRIPCVCESEFAACVPLAKLQQMPNVGDIEFIADKVDGVTIRHGSFTAKFDSHDPAEFPALVEIKSIYETELSRSDLDEIKAVLPMASSDSSRAILTAVYFTGDRVVTTDTHRLAMANVSVSDLPNALIPADFLDTLSKVIPKKTERVTMSLSETNVEFRTEGMIIVNRLIEGRFPNYENAIPEIGASIEVANADMIQAFYLMAPLWKNNQQRVGFTPDISGKSLKLSCWYLCDTAEMDVPCTIAGEIPTMAFNAGYFTQGMSFIRGTNLTWHLSAGEEDPSCKPMMMQHDNRTYVLMPMQAE